MSAKANGGRRRAVFEVLRKRMEASVPVPSERSEFVANERAEVD
jgi:hypothetical protein